MAGVATREALLDKDDELGAGLQVRAHHQKRDAMPDADVILLGGGLANALIALRLAALRPGLRVKLIEAGDRIGGNHTWSYHASDVEAATGQWLDELARHRWPSVEVAFPGFERRLGTGYRTILSADLHERVMAGACEVELGSAGELADGTTVLRADGSRVRATCVIDGRGVGTMPGLAVGYQKFLGVEVRTVAAHGLDAPLIMDARVEQIDGYRFIYVLPFADDRLLIEDTMYSDAPDLDRMAVTARITDYAAGRGWRIGSVERVESGVLPIVLSGALDDLWPVARAQEARSGMRAGLFHQTTGYSVPFAARLADAIAAIKAPATEAVARLARGMAEESWKRQAFYRLLNRLLFLAAEGGRRREVMGRFYRLSEPLIERFYAERTTALDMARILSGRPPVPVARAFKAIDPRSARARRMGLSGPEDGGA